MRESCGEPCPRKFWETFSSSFNTYEDHALPGFAGTERGARVSQFSLNPRGERVRATEYAPRGPSRVFDGNVARTGINTCRDEDVYRSILGPTCIEDALDAGHGGELRALGLNEAQVRLLFPCPSADLNSCAKGGRLKLLKVLPLVHR